jgi:hypothetical protein
MRYVKDPSTGRRVSRMNAESEWILAEVPELRIIDDELWKAAKTRHGEIADKYVNVTEANIAELAATTFVALIIALLSVRTIKYTGEQRGGGEGVGQSPLKDKAFSTFSSQKPPFELRPKTGVRACCGRPSTW